MGGLPLPDQGESGYWRYTGFCTVSLPVPLNTGSRGIFGQHEPASAAQSWSPVPPVPETMTLNCSEDPVPALKHGSDQNQRWETSGQTIATNGLLVLSRASMPWVYEHVGFGAASVSQQLHFIAADRRHLWSHDQLSKAQRKRIFLPMLIYSASCSDLNPAPPSLNISGTNT